MDNTMNNNCDILLQAYIEIRNDPADIQIDQQKESKDKNTVN
jgi:hypothetical protein